MSVQFRLLAKAPGSLRPSLGELAIALAEPTVPAGLGEFAGAEADDAAVDGEVAADDPIAAEAAGGGAPLLFEVHALSKASATHAALTAVAAARRWWCCDKVALVSTVARGSAGRLPGSEETVPG
jgi:hypothetical protein